MEHSLSIGFFRFVEARKVIDQEFQNRMFQLNGGFRADDVALLIYTHQSFNKSLERCSIFLFVPLFCFISNVLICELVYDFHNINYNVCVFVTKKPNEEGKCS